MQKTVLPFDSSDAQMNVPEDRRPSEYALKRLWFLGDVHASFGHIAKALLDASAKPSRLVFLGDIDMDHMPFAQALAALRSLSPDTRVAFIHGNHDSDSCHPDGFEKLDELARSLGVLRSFHGHTHDDLTEQYKLRQEALGFEAIAVNYCSIENGLGEPISLDPEGW